MAAGREPDDLDGDGRESERGELQSPVAVRAVVEREQDGRDDATQAADDDEEVSVTRGGDVAGEQARDHAGRNLRQEAADRLQRVEMANLLVDERRCDVSSAQRTMDAPEIWWIMNAPYVIACTTMHGVKSGRVHSDGVMSGARP